MVTGVEGFGGDLEGWPCKTGEVGTTGARRTGMAAPARVVKLFLRVPKRKREVRPPVVLEELEEREGLWERLAESVSKGGTAESVDLAV